MNQRPRNSKESSSKINTGSLHLLTACSIALHIDKNTEKEDLQPVFELGTITDSPQLPECYPGVWQPVCIYDSHIITGI